MACMSWCTLKTPILPTDAFVCECLFHFLLLKLLTQVANENALTLTPADPEPPSSAEPSEY